MTTQEFYLEIFDSRNTSTTTIINATSAPAAQSRARRLSMTRKFPVIVKTMDGRYWVKYEGGEQTEWSA